MERKQAIKASSYFQVSEEGLNPGNFIMVTNDTGLYGVFAPSNSAFSESKMNNMALPW